ALQEGPPQHHILTEADIDAHHLAHAIGPHAVGHHHGHTLDPTALADMLIAGVQPEIRVDGVQPAFPEDPALLIKALGHAAHFALGEAGDPELLHQRLDLARAHALHIRFRNDRDEGLLAASPRLQPAREVAAAAQLGNRHLNRAQARVERPAAIAVALRRALVAALIPPGANHGTDFGFDEFLQERAQPFPQKVRAVLGQALAQRLQHRHAVLGHRCAPFRASAYSPAWKRTGGPCCQGLRFTPHPGTLSLADAVPTHVGVNRARTRSTCTPTRSPHARGGEPYGELLPLFLSGQSPRTWG